ncbi:helix-turn-helix transcriptional regulator [Arcobacter roscoffensis]|uniref:WYL domain-containing protein n=1 Tax=Arcobacter roscoffensis TaxID=2961520 RepID=A0ABY5E2J0_9BACT|nr:WYL domain-containing protein [Arcobacter roscoffensis]UTJ05940.1 WYL domain-containing protein [Arcobacter roscoffensis]
MKKHDYDKILFRLTSIWQRLREGEILSVKDLAKEYNVSTKTIQRDFNERLASKLPIEKSGHKWKVKEGHSIDKNLSFEEDLVLDILKELSLSMGNTFSSSTNKLFSKIQNRHETPIFSKIEIEDISNKTEIIKDIQESIKNKTQIQFQYKNKYRFIEPYKITTFDGYWYLYGNDILTNRLKTFYIKDIESLNSTDKTYKENPNAIEKLKLAINVWFEPNEDLFQIRLLVKKEISKYFVRRPLNSSQIITKKYNDESIEILLDITSENEILFELKKWQPHLLVIEPKSLAKKILIINREFLDNQLELLI